MPGAMHPAGVETEMIGPAAHGIDDALQAHPRLAPMFTNLLPVRRLEPVDASHAVVCLASDESRYVTSMKLTVDVGHAQF